MFNVVSSYLSLQLYFDQEIKNNYQIDKIDNYKIVSCRDEKEEVEILSIDIDQKDFINEINITLRDCKNNHRYKLFINNFKFLYKDGTIEECQEFEYTARSEQPTVIKVVSVSSVNMIVHFTKEMNFNKDILNKNRYRFVVGDLEVIKVEKHSESSVKLLTTKQTPGKLYQLTVK